MEDKSQVVAIEVYHTDNGVFNNSYFMEDIFKNHQKIRFSWDGDSHQNGAAERTTNMVVTMASTMLMYAGLICPKYILSTDFGQCK